MFQLHSNHLFEETKSCLVGTLTHQTHFYSCLLSWHISSLQNNVIFKVEHTDSKPFGDESVKIFPILCRKLLLKSLQVVLSHQ